MQIIEKILSLSILLGLFNTTLLHCLKKWKILDKYAIYRKKWMPAADCYLCLSFQFGCLQTGLLLVCGEINNLYYLLVPFCSAAIANYLINIAIIHDYRNRQ